MTGKFRLVMAILAVGLLTTASYGTISYHGSLASDFNTGNSTWADGLLEGYGVWVNDPGDSQWVPAQIEWEITQHQLGDPWRYHYKVTVYKGALSHLIVETSDGFTDGHPDIYDVGSSPNFGGIDVKTHFPPGEGSGGSSQPGMPDPIYGIKFDDFLEPSGDDKVKVGEVWFTSVRVPVWGDFYAVDGSHGAAWNAGLTDFDGDPLNPASSGSVFNHLLVPDTLTSYDIIPEPTSMTFIGLCLGGLFVRLRRKGV